jgi:hypothetical protein
MLCLERNDAILLRSDLLWEVEKPLRRTWGQIGSERSDLNDQILCNRIILVRAPFFQATLSESWRKRSGESRIIWVSLYAFTKVKPRTEHQTGCFKTTPAHTVRDEYNLSAGTDKTQKIHGNSQDQLCHWKTMRWDEQRCARQHWSMFIPTSPSYHGLCAVSKHDFEVCQNLWGLFGRWGVKVSASGGSATAIGLIICSCGRFTVPSSVFFYSLAAVHLRNCGSHRSQFLFMLKFFVSSVFHFVDHFQRFHLKQIPN